MSHQGDHETIDFDIPWTALGLLNSWVQYTGYGTPRYKRVNGIVYVEIMVQGGITSHVADLPIGCRPKYNTLWCGNSGEPNSYGWNEIHSNGAIVLQTNALWFAMTVSFPAEQ